MLTDFRIKNLCDLLGTPGDWRRVDNGVVLSLAKEVLAARAMRDEMIDEYWEHGSGVEIFVVQRPIVQAYDKARNGEK